LKKRLGVLCGTIIGLGTFVAFAALDLRLFGWPDFDWRNAQAWGDGIAAAPTHAKAMLAGSAAIAALTGGLIAVRIAEWPMAGWIVTGAIASAAAVAALLVPLPLWMQVAAIVGPLAAGMVVSGASGPA
jgi:hypothetical protein